MQWKKAVVGVILPAHFLEVELPPISCFLSLPGWMEKFSAIMFPNSSLSREAPHRGDWLSENFLIEMEINTFMRLDMIDAFLKVWFH